MWAEIIVCLSYQLAEELLYLQQRPFISFHTTRVYASMCIHSSLNQGEKVAVSVRLVRNVAPTRHMFLGAVWVICNTSYHVISMLAYCTNNFYEELPLGKAQSASNTLM